jgi:hypothetical protein
VKVNLDLDNDPDISAAIDEICARRETDEDVLKPDRLAAACGMEFVGFVSCLAKARGNRLLAWELARLRFGTESNVAQLLRALVFHDRRTVDLAGDIIG